MAGTAASKHQETLTIWPHRSLMPRGFAIVMGVLASLADVSGAGR